MSELDTPDAYKINSDPLLTMKEAAAYLNISSSSMYALTEREKIPIVLITSDRKIRKSVLNDFITRREEPWR